MSRCINCIFKIFEKFVKKAIFLPKVLTKDDTYPTPSFNITENSAIPTPSPDIVIISTNCLRFLKYSPNMTADDSRTMAAPTPTTIPAEQKIY